MMEGRMNGPVLSRHAEARIRQRGLRESDIEVILQVATQVAEDAWVVTRQDAARETARLKRRFATIERLHGKKVIMAGDTLVTVYHAQSPGPRRRRRSRKA